MGGSRERFARGRIVHRHALAGIVVAMAIGFLCSGRIASAQTLAHNASCAAGSCNINGVPSLPGFTCSSDADCESLIHPACPTLSICEDATCETTASYQTLAVDGKCKLGRDVTLFDTIVLPSFVDLDCEGMYTISPASPAAPGDYAGSDYTRTGAQYTLTGGSISTPQLAVFLNGVHGSTVEGCKIEGFDFGVVVINTKVPILPVNLNTDPVAGSALQNQIRDNAIDARFGAVALAFADDTLIRDNSSLSTQQRGATTVWVSMDSTYTTIDGNDIFAYDNGFTGSPRFPGYTGASNPIYTCGQSVGVAQYVGNNALCPTIAPATMLNTVVGGTLFQAPLFDPVTKKAVASTASTTFGPNNQITVFPPLTFCLKNTAPSTSIVQSKFSGGFLSIGVATNGAQALPGSCNDGSGRYCLSDADCDHVPSSCVLNSTLSGQISGSSVTIDRNQITVPDPSVPAATQLPQAMNIGGVSAVVTNNFVTYASNGSPTTVRQGILLGPNAVEGASGALVSGNTLSGLTYPLVLNDPALPSNTSYGAKVGLNDLVGTVGAPVHPAVPFNLTANLPGNAPPILPGNYFGPNAACTSPTTTYDDVFITSPLVQDTMAACESVAPPVLALPRNLLVEATSGAGAAASWPAVTATDFADGSSPPATCSAQSGATFALGTTTVSCTATGQTATQPASGTFTVTVIDTTAPALTLPNIDSPSATVTFSATATDLVDGPTPVACSPASGSTFPLGMTTQVTCSSTDSHGNKASGAFEVTTPPQVTCPADPPPVECANANRTASLAAGNASASDTCAPVTVSDPSQTVTLPIGSTIASATATHTASDGCGLSSTCQNSVTLVDSTPPAVVCPANRAPIECTSASRSATLASGSAHATDACSSAVAVVDPSPTVTLPAGSALATVVVQHTAIDQSGLTSTCQNTVTLQDSRPPAFDLASLRVQTVAGNCAGTPIPYSTVPTPGAITVPTASDACSGAVTVTCAPLGRPGKGPSFLPGNSFGLDALTCTATDASGNTASAILIVAVLPPLDVELLPPLTEDNGQGAPFNAFTVGQTIQHRVALRDCSNHDVTPFVPVTVRLVTAAGANGSGPDLINNANDYSGIGDAGGYMLLDGGHYEFDLKANTSDYVRGGQVYRSTVSVWYDLVPSVIVGTRDALLKSK